MKHLGTWEHRFNKELEMAERARASGNEGMARVCARRAAGIVIAEYLRLQGLELKTHSAYDYLRYLSLSPDIPSDVKNVVDHFLTRITPDYRLPVEADLIAETRWLRQRLLAE